MTEKTEPKNLSRRNFLKIAAAAGVVAVGGSLLYTYTPWLDDSQEAGLIREPLEGENTLNEKLKEIVRYATLAASGHNTQPWKFVLIENGIEIHPDLSRRLAVVDPQDRELWISLGCALENLILAAGAAGFSSQVTYPDAQDFIRVTLSEATPHADALFSAIPLRQNTRSEFDGRPVDADDFSQLQALSLEPGIQLKFFVHPDELTGVADYVRQGDLIQYADKNFVDELIVWLRFNKREALASHDGLFSRCSGNPEVPRWLGSLFVSNTKPEQQADADVKKLLSSAGAVVIASDDDNKSAWVRTGQIYERLTLLMTSMNIKSALLNQPVEVEDVRSQFQAGAGLGALAPQMLVRFGYADEMPRSQRRAASEVIAR